MLIGSGLICKQIVVAPLYRMGKWATRWIDTEILSILQDQVSSFMTKNQSSLDLGMGTSIT